MSTFNGGQSVRDDLYAMKRRVAAKRGNLRMTRSEIAQIFSDLETEIQVGLEAV